MATIGKQYSIGEQGNARKDFYFSGMSKCQQCGQSTSSSSDTAGCRMNGDAYGTDTYHCACGWSTSFQWDEASDTYYYETAGWARERERQRERERAIVVVPAAPLPFSEDIPARKVGHRRLAIIALGLLAIIALGLLISAPPRLRAEG